MALVEVSNLTYTYPDSQAPALKDITFQVEAGQFLAVVGANGAGKSSLCLALAGLIPAVFHGQMQGSVRVAGMDTRQHSPGQLVGRVGLVLQNPANQLSGMRYTVYEEAAFGLENLGLPPADMPERVERALAWVGLKELGDRSPYTLSGGQQQRLALASILVFEPEILVLDEPTAMLDPSGTQSVFGIIEALVRAGTTVIMTGHTLEPLARYAERVIAMASGEVILEGSPQSVFTDPLLKQTGVGWLRYTQAAELGQSRGLWPVGRALPVTVEQAAEGFQQANARNASEEQDDEHSN